MIADSSFSVMPGVALRIAALCASTVASVALRISAISPASFVTRNSPESCVALRYDV